MKIIRRIACASLAFGLVFFGGGLSAQAETIPFDSNCKLALVTYMNGYVMVSFTGSSALTLTKCELQTRPKGGSDSDWSAVSSVNLVVLGPGGTDNNTGKYAAYKVALLADADVRLRGLNASDETDWVVKTVEVPLFPVTPAAYSMSASYSPAGSTIDQMLKDGCQSHTIELGTAAGEWIQFDLGAKRHIGGLRLVPRLAFTGRLQNAVVTVSDNSDMSEATTAIASTTSTQTGVEAFRWDFPTPCEGRYIRVTVPTKENWIDIVEIEPYAITPAESDFKLSVQQAAYNDAHPKVTLSASWGSVDGWTLQRAFSDAGPWTTVATGDALTRSAIDSLPSAVSATYYYRVIYDCHSLSGDPLQYATAAVSHRLLRCLERDWTTPTSLYSGVTVLTDCQGSTVNGFNGTLNDMIKTTANPLIGLDLAEDYHLVLGFALSRSSGYGINTPISLWGSNVMPVNTPAAQTEDDPNYTELYRTTEAGGAVLGYWYRFPVPAAAQATNYRYAFFHKNAADAAKANWGNFAEGTFYGYSDADVATAALIAPESFVGSRLPTGFTFAWTPGYNCTSYILQRKQDDGDWTDLATYGTDVFAATDTNPGASGMVCSYRIKVVKDAETRHSPVFSQLWYAPGSGTGLLATYTAPSPASSADPTEARLGSETMATIDVTKAADAPLYGAVADNVLVMWKGKLIIPFAGSYSFQATATDGFLLEIDGDVYLTDANVMSTTDTRPCSILNSWSTTAGAATVRTSNAVTLTAGEHQIRVWWNPTTGAKRCTLAWSIAGGAFETIPSSQFIPAAEPEIETYGKENWRYKVISSAHGYIRQIQDDRFVISEYEPQGASDRSFRNGSFCWKKISEYAFTLEADLYAPQMFDQWGYVFVSANLNGGVCGNDSTLILYRKARRNRVNVRSRTGEGTGQPAAMLANDYPVAPGGVDADPGYVWLRIIRRGPRFTLQARQGGANPGAVVSGAPGRWQTVATYDDVEGRFGKDVYVGFGGTSNGSGGWVYQGRYIFSDVKLRPVRGVALIVK